MSKANPYSSTEYKKNRKAVLEANNYTCHYCHGPANTADHIIPISSGIVDHSISNLLPCCTKCNSARGNKTRIRISYWNKRYG